MKNNKKIGVIGSANGPTAVFVAGHGTYQLPQAEIKYKILQRFSIGMIVWVALRFTLWVAKKVR